MSPSPGPSWTCPACRGRVVMTAASERQPVVCQNCGARYRHPRVPLLLSAALPGLGSLVQGRRVWGGAMLLAGTGAFAWTLWRMAAHLRDIAAGSNDLLPLLADASLGVGLVMLAYGLDVAVVWLLRDRLREVQGGTEPGR